MKKQEFRGIPRVKEAPPTLLHVDDDPNDAELFQAAAVRAKARFAIQNVGDGEQAMAYLNGLIPYSDRVRFPLPDLILLDLKMPKATGFDVLKWIRSHPQLGDVPVVILSGSQLHDDIELAYSFGADSYLVKPIGFNALVELVSNLDTSWGRGVSRSQPALLSSAATRMGWSRTREWLATVARTQASA